MHASGKNIGNYQNMSRQQVESLSATPPAPTLTLRHRKSTPKPRS